MADISIREALLRFLKQHPNEDITYSEMEEMLPELTRDQIKNGLHGLARSNLAGALERTGGSTWVYTPPTGRARKIDIRSDHPDIEGNDHIGTRVCLTIVAAFDEWGYIGVTDNGQLCRLGIIRRAEIMSPEGVEALREMTGMRIVNTDDIAFT